MKGSTAETNFVLPTFLQIKDIMVATIVLVGIIKSLLVALFCPSLVYIKIYPLFWFVCFFISLVPFLFYSAPGDSTYNHDVVNVANIY